MNAIRPVVFLSLCIVLVVGSPCGVHAVEDNELGRLTYVSSASRDSLRAVTSVEVTNDGKFLYAAAWQAAAINVFSRDVATGQLTHVQEIADSKNLAGATAVRLSPDGRYAIAAAFRSRTAVLYQRQPDGTLTRLDVARNGIDGITGLQFAVDVAISPDSKFIYVVNTTGSVTTFEISEEQTLQFVEANIGQDDCFANARGIVTHPDGKTIVVASSEAASLVVLNRDPDNGKVTVRQIIRDNEGDVRGLDGAMGVALSPDGAFAYTSAGRFRGDNAIGVYKFDDNGELNVVQEFVNDEDELRNFRGGNEIALSPDGLNVYAVASESSSLACFARDPQSGKLRFLETIANQDGRFAAVAGIGISPDGRFVHVAAEGSQQISVYRRAQEEQD